MNKDDKLLIKIAILFLLIIIGLAIADVASGRMTLEPRLTPEEKRAVMWLRNN